MKKRAFASLYIALIAILCASVFVILINANYSTAPAAIIDDAKHEIDITTDSSAMPAATPHTTYNMRETESSHPSADYFTNSYGEVIHSSQRNKDVRHVDVRLNSYSLEYIPGAANLWSSAVIEVTYADNIKEIHGISESVRWSSSDVQVLEVQQGGNIFVVGVGTARIIAEYRGVISEKEVTVLQGDIARIEVWPEEIIMIQGISDDGRYVSYMPQISIVAYTSRGNSFRLPHDSSILNVRSENPDIITDEALMSDTFASEGSNALFHDSSSSGRTARITGESYIEFSIIDIDGQARRDAPSIRVPVTALCISDISDIDIWHHCDTLPIGMSSGFAPSAVFNCGRMFDIFHYTEWTVDAPEIIQINSFGMITALSLGEATITASYGGVSSSITIRVVEDTVSYVDHIPFP
ncbi:MAG: hypothetical protein FWE42_01170 [Defluviitaleaceae bacterium]|nr:hypothetical protein [Defluviitaleaceae bacterium]